MIDPRQLYALQTIDLALDANREALARVEAALGDSQELLEAGAELEARQRHLADAQARQRDLEWEVEGLRDKVSLDEKKLYSGSVRNPRELSGIQADVRSIQERLRQREDVLLDIMSEVEVAQQAWAEQKALVERLDEEWRGEQARLRGEGEALGADLARLDEERQAEASQVDPGAMDLYQRLRQTKQGRGVSKVEGGMCQGCRVNLPMSELNRARAGRELVQCGNCGRILYVA